MFRNRSHFRRVFRFPRWLLLLALGPLVPFWFSVTPETRSSAPLAPFPALDLGRVAGTDDGVLPQGTTVFDGQHPAVTRLQPRLLAALRQAAMDARQSGIFLVVNSGWRSTRYQHQLFQEAVVQHGTERAALRWVAPADRSAHVTGDAVDLAPAAATSWLARHGSRYGLCQIYQNEPWHFELRPRAKQKGCPPMFHDPGDDPALQ